MTAQDAEMPDDYAEAWLIELKSPPPMQGPTYWGLDDDEAEGVGWTRDHLRAQRFSRKEDAEMMIEYFGWTEATAVQHAWGLAPKSRTASPSVEGMLPEEDGWKLSVIAEMHEGWFRSDIYTGSYNNRIVYSGEGHTARAAVLSALEKIRWRSCRRGGRLFP